jgi:5-methylcytosine-specific restriction protein A
MRDGYACQWPIGGGLRCRSTFGLECDHILASGPDVLENLQTLCRPHHKIKSSGEGGRAAGALRKRIAAAKVRPAKPHPGLRPEE